jgi:hypothetical protein
MPESPGFSTHEPANARKGKQGMAGAPPRLPARVTKARRADERVGLNVS